MWITNLGDKMINKIIFGQYGKDDTKIFENEVIVDEQELNLIMKQLIEDIELNGHLNDTKVNLFQQFNDAHYKIIDELKIMYGGTRLKTIEYFALRYLDELIFSGNLKKLREFLKTDG